MFFTFLGVMFIIYLSVSPSKASVASHSDGSLDRRGRVLDLGGMNRSNAIELDESHPEFQSAYPEVALGSEASSEQTYDRSENFMWIENGGTLRSPTERTPAGAIREEAEPRTETLNSVSLEIA